MGWKRPALGDLGQEPEALVVIPHQLTWRAWLALVPLAVAILFLLFLLVGHALSPEQIEATGLWPSSVEELFVKYANLVMCLTIPTVGLSIALIRYAEFAVWKDGLTLNTSRLGLKRTISRSRDLGFYSWNEVSCCSWSNFEPGMLIVHLEETRNQAATDFFGIGFNSTATTPPMYVFYFVAVPYRDAVEKAIRGCGKWSE